jgi:hypothetical protein
MMTMVMTYYSNLMAMTQDSMAYLKNNDGNARRYYLRRAEDQYLQGRRKHQNIGGGHQIPGALLDIDKGTEKISPGNIGDGRIGGGDKTFLDIPYRNWMFLTKFLLT